MDQSNNDPLHGKSLETVVAALVEHYGWGELGWRIDIRCFNYEPSVGSSLKFLRKTPWARKKVEELYVRMVREQERREEQREAKEMEQKQALEAEQRDQEKSKSVDVAFNTEVLPDDDSPPGTSL